MFSPYVFAQSAVLSFVPRTENIKKKNWRKQLTIPVIQTHGKSAGLVQVWHGFGTVFSRNPNFSRQKS